MFVRPDNWNELTPLERRKLRLDHWESGADEIEFVSPEAEANYRERMTRMRKTYDLEHPDRIIADISMGAGEYALRRSGLNGKDMCYHPEKLYDPIVKFNEEFQPDTAVGAFPYIGPAMDTLNLQTYIWGGQKLDDNQTIQAVEGEYMTGDEYAEFIADPSGFFIHKYLPRMFGALGPLGMMPNFPQLTEIVDVMSLTIPFGLPPVQEMLNKLMEAGNQTMAALGEIGKLGSTVAAMGFPSMGSNFCKAPFDFLGDTLRGTKGVLTDMFRRPNEVLAACEAYVPVLTRSIINACDQGGTPMVMFPLHKGADGFMSQAQFEKFYWPTFKAVMMAFYEEGLTNSLFVEGSYDSRLETIAEMPEKSCHWLFDQTDMRKVKETLSDKFSVAGNVPPSLMTTGSVDDLRAYCDNLVELFDDAPGYILGFGCGFEWTTDEKIRAYQESVLK